MRPKRATANYAYRNRLIGAHLVTRLECWFEFKAPGAKEVATTARPTLTLAPVQPPFDRETLRQVVGSGARPKFLFFWGHTAKPGSNGRECLSQWFPAPFESEGVTYATAEHYMMAGKARLFGDSRTLARILAAKSPAEAKKLGRAVSGFTDDVWNAHRFQIVVQGSLAKFQSNPEIRSFLLNTGKRVLVEASPRDRIWGIGMAASHPHAENPAEWRGLNLLGFALMTARSRLRSNAPHCVSRAFE